MWFWSGNDTNKISVETKAKVLVALYNNAKTSQRTRQVIFFTKVPDPYLFNTIGDLYKKEIDDEIKSLNLDLPQAILILKKRSYVDYLGPVEIKIDFSQDNIDTTFYDKAHCQENSVKSAAVIINDITIPATHSWRCNIL